MKRASKYNAKKTVVDNIAFHSKREAERYLTVWKPLFKAGKIQTLELQKQFDFVLNGIKICSYRADACFFRDGRRVVEDVKGARTAVYNIKKKMMRAFFNIEVLEV